MNEKGRIKIKSLTGQINSLVREPAHRCALSKSPSAKCAQPAVRPAIMVYCADYRCSHSIAMRADQWPDDVRLSDIEPRFVCQACGKRGADVRPH